MRLKNKKVLVMGLGLHGGGVAVVNWLIKHGAKVTVTDLKTKKELAPSLLGLARLQAIKLVLGQHRDIVIQNPAVPRESKYLKIARKSGATIENEASFFFKHCKGKIIGITGTRGKSTTATLIYELLNISRGGSQPAPTTRVNNIWLAGLPQRPMIAILDQVRNNDLVILELSSWQLEILGQQKTSPHVAVITNIYPDHLNRYSGMNSYINAKKNIFRFQTKDNYSILNLDSPEVKKIGKTVVSQKFWFSKNYFNEQNGCFIKNDNIIFRHDGKESKLASLKDIKLAGEHNLENVLAALPVAGIYKVSAKKIAAFLKKPIQLPGRLEFIRTVQGVRYINDTTATTPEATMAALKTLSCNMKHETCNKIILIAGGSDKGLNFKELIEDIKKYCKALILLKGKGTDRIKKMLQVSCYKFHVTEVNNMIEAVSIVRSFSKKGDIILLSPACASFGLFINEFDRGDQFNKAVEKL